MFDFLIFLLAFESLRNPKTVNEETMRNYLNGNTKAMLLFLFMGPIMYFWLFFNVLKIDSHLDQGIDPMETRWSKGTFSLDWNDDHRLLMTSFTFSYIQEGKKMYAGHVALGWNLSQFWQASLWKWKYCFQCPVWNCESTSEQPFEETVSSRLIRMSNL